MPTKIKCCQKSLVTPISCNSSSSSSSHSCCKQYPICKCSSYKNKCLPIYYPNNYINQYACPPKCNTPPFCHPQHQYPPQYPHQYPSQCPPHPSPHPPPPPPCNPTQSNIFYNTNPTIITGNGTTINMILNQAYNINIFNPITDSSGNINLPDICTSLCNSNKIFIISNISSSNTINLVPNLSNLINGLNNMVIIPCNTSITLYASCISDIGYWSVIGLI